MPVDMGTHPASGITTWKKPPPGTMMVQDAGGTARPRASMPEWWNKPVEGMQDQPTAQQTQESKTVEEFVKETQEKLGNAEPNPISASSESVSTSPPVSCPESESEGQDDIGLIDILPHDSGFLISRCQKEFDTLDLLKESLAFVGIKYYDFPAAFKETVRQHLSEFAPAFWSGKSYQTLTALRPVWSADKKCKAILRSLQYTAFVRALGAS